MLIEEFQHLVEMVISDDLHWTENSNDYHWSIFGSVVCGIKDNDPNVISYLATCSDDIRQRFYDAYNQTRGCLHE